MHGKASKFNLILIISLLIPLIVAYPVSLCAEDQSSNENENTLYKYIPTSVGISASGYYIVAGNSHATGPDYDISSWIWGVDSNGNKVKEMTFKSPKHMLKDIIITEGGFIPIGSFVGNFFRSTDGNFVFGETTNSRRDYEDPHNLFKIFKEDQNKKIIWERIHDITGNDANFYVIVGGNLKDGDYVFLAKEGNYDKFGRGSSKVWLVICDQTGNIKGKVSLPNGRIYADGQHLLAINKDTFAFTYSASEFPPCENVPRDLSFSAKIACFNYHLEKKWERILTGYDDFLEPRILLTADGDYLVAGAVDKGIKVSKISAGGDIIWERNYQSDEKGSLYYHVAGLAATEGMCLVAGCVSVKDDPERVFLLKFCPKTSNIIWQKTYK
ncbi:MAG TPA: hypothetical protein VMW42_00660 [Desulfatiglandales bacterium]|nr:hypothetical protein [Desulfatiglandales bacterium]